MKPRYPFTAESPDALEEFQRKHLGELDFSSCDVPTTICGLDVAYEENRAYAAAVVLEHTNDGFETTETQLIEVDDVGPYRPGHFALREAHALIEVLALLDAPDMLLIDAHGTAHPKRFGLASIIGVLFDVPTVGCAKNLLCGNFDGLELEKGAWAAIIDNDETIGAAVRTVDDVNPVFVSPGHRVDLQSAIATVLAWSDGVRIPEPIRAAHDAAETRKRTNID